MIDTSSTVKTETNISSSFLDRMPIETVIEIVRLSLLQVDYHPLVIMRRVEELRLVDTYWAKCIDQCPTFWTHITSQASPARYTRWLEKSQNAPLNVECRSDDKFMELLLPYAQRWQSLVFFSSSPNAWSTLTRPAPLLQELDLHCAESLKEPAELFQGVTPRLHTVRLHGTLVPWNSNILRGLRELVLDGFPSRQLDRPIQLEGFLRALESSPLLEILVVKGWVYPGNNPSPNLALVTLLSLRTFIFESKSELGGGFGNYQLLGAIRFPNCTVASIKFDSPTPSVSEFPRDIWLSVVDILRLTVAIDINLSPSRLALATRPGSSPRLNVEFTSTLLAERMLIDLLREAEFSQSLSTEVYLNIESPDAFPPILDFLVKPTESGIERLPRFQELYLKVHMVPVEKVAGIILDHDELRSVLWSRPLKIGEGWSRPEEIKNRIRDAPPQQRWLR